MVTHNFHAKSLSLGLAALRLASVANAEGAQIDTELDGWARHSNLGDPDGDGGLELITSAWHSDAFTVHLNAYAAWQNGLNPD